MKAGDRFDNKKLFPFACLETAREILFTGIKKKINIRILPGPYVISPFSRKVLFLVKHKISGQCYKSTDCDHTFHNTAHIKRDQLAGFSGRYSKDILPT